MNRKELARWGIPALGFISYVAWGGVSLALAFAAILFAVVSALIRWHGKDPAGFFRGMRVWSVLLVLLPAIGLTLGALATSPVLVVPALALVAVAVYLVRWTTRHATGEQPSGASSMTAQNLDTANELTSQITERNRRTHGRGMQLHVQAENLDLIRKAADLENQNVALQQRVRTLEREAALPVDPFADPLPKPRTQA